MSKYRCDDCGKPGEYSYGLVIWCEECAMREARAYAPELSKSDHRAMLESFRLPTWIPDEDRADHERR